MITITGESKEIAALVVALQERQVSVNFNCGKVNSSSATEIQQRIQRCLLEKGKGTEH